MSNNIHQDVIDTLLAAKPHLIGLNKTAADRYYTLGAEYMSDHLARAMNSTSEALAKIEYVLEAMKEQVGTGQGGET